MPFNINIFKYLFVFYIFAFNLAVFCQSKGTDLHDFRKRQEEVKRYLEKYDILFSPDVFSEKFDTTADIDIMKKFEEDIYKLFRDCLTKVLESIKENPTLFPISSDNLQNILNDFNQLPKADGIAFYDFYMLKFFNDVLLKIYERIYIEFYNKDPCPLFYQKSQMTEDEIIKLDNYCKIVKSPCLFSKGLQRNILFILEEEKNKLIKSFQDEKKFKKFVSYYSNFPDCLLKDKKFIEEVKIFKDNLMVNAKVSLEKNDFNSFEKYLDYLKVFFTNEEIKKEFEQLILNKKNEFCNKINDTKNLHNKIEEIMPNFKEILAECQYKPIELLPKEEIQQVILEKKFNLNEPYIVLDIWQSAWGDFSDLQLLLDYIKNNKISEINLNIGKEITEKQETQKKAREILKDLVPKLYQAGANKVNLLYAELNYPIENYAKFLSENKDLGIDKIVDDSEFVDHTFDKYIINSNSVKRHNITYSTFVTLENVGNSGVSDSSRRYLLKEADEVILMSYFSCNFEEQKEWLFPYLKYADELGRKNKVRIALLLGGKSVGREKSCEGIGEKAFSDLILNLHNWALNFASYDGIVIETNRKLPSFNISNNYAKIEKD